MGQHPLPEESLTVAELLKAAGYATGLIGKWGLGGPDSSGEPNRQGFDYFYGYLCQRHAHNYYPEFLVDGKGHRLTFRFDSREDDYFRDSDGNPVPAPDGDPYMVKGSFGWDEEGNLICRRSLPDGRTFDVVKNFPSEDELRRVIGGAGERAEYRDWPELARWLLTYTVAAPPRA